MVKFAVCLMLLPGLLLPALGLAQTPLQRVVVMNTALEIYQFSRAAFTNNGIPTDAEIDEHLKGDAQILSLSTPLAPAKFFDFTLQREINQELGAK